MCFGGKYVGKGLELLYLPCSTGGTDNNTVRQGCYGVICKTNDQKGEGEQGCAKKYISRSHQCTYSLFGDKSDIMKMIVTLEQIKCNFDTPQLISIKKMFRQSPLHKFSLAGLIGHINSSILLFFVFQWGIIL